jgi:hypothetical protein
VIPAFMLAVIPYRLERNPEITQALTDLFYFNLMMPWPTYIVQNWTFAYAILKDRRARPLFSKYFAYFNIVAPLFYLPGTAMPTTKTGPLAWNGVLSFWILGMVFCLQLIVDSIGLFYAIQSEGKEEMLLNLASQKSDQALNGSQSSDSGV